MRTTFSLLTLALTLALSAPAQAQLRADAGGPAPVQLFDQGHSAVSFMTRLFQSGHVRMNHSYEMSVGGFGGETASLSMYTNTVAFQFNEQWAGRVDVAVAHQPFGSAAGMERQPQVFLRNAEIAYRPSENMQIRLQVRQNPFARRGPWGGPFGRMGFGHAGFGHAGFGRASFGTMGMGAAPRMTPTEELFFRSSR
jgi:hypothetical protein